MAKMIIVRGKPYEVKFIVKQVGASVPMELDPTDTAEIYISSKGHDGDMLINKALTQGDPTQGEFVLQLTASETLLLPYAFSFKEDGEVAMPTCKGHISTVTVEAGNGEITIPNIYIEDVGITSV